MYTVEMDFDEVVITVLDEFAENEDIKVHLLDDVVYIRQYDEKTDRTKTISVSPLMWEELVAAINSPQGAFVRRP